MFHVLGFYWGHDSRSWAGLASSSFRTVICSTRSSVDCAVGTVSSVWCDFHSDPVSVERYDEVGGSLALTH